MAKPSDEREVKIYRVERSFQGYLDRALGEEKVREPLVDIYESRERVRIEVELPGVKRDEIEAYVIKDKVFVRGYKREEFYLEVGEEKRRFICLEREFGEYYREIEMPVPCNTAQGRARLEDGVLVIEFPKVEDRRGQRRDIKIE